MTKTALSTILIFLFAAAAISDEPVRINSDQYLSYATEAAESYWNHYDEYIQQWAGGIDLEHVFGYRPPSEPIFLAYVSAWLYDLTGDSRYAERARKCLVEYGEFRTYYPEDFWTDKPGYESGPAPIGNFFFAPMYIKAYMKLEESGVFSETDKEIIIENIVLSCDQQLRTQEWGAMNRGMIRAEVFHLASKAVGDHPQADTYKMIAKAIYEDSWGAWEIEDASHYNAIHLYSLVSLAEYLDEEQFWNFAVTRYMMQFYTHLLAPYGMIPDFGDAHLYSNWWRWTAILEKAATEFQDGEIKYAATRIARSLWPFDKSKKSMWGAVIAIDCWRWSDDDLKPLAPKNKSEIVLEDVIGKKIVFRSGYDAKATYMLLNFKDEGIAGFLDREYLRLSIPVEEEKMTHGHSDENDISLLMTDGSILLHDGGYRDMMPSGPYGAYRADYFHNRVVIRPGKIFKGQEKGLYRYSVKDSAAIAGQPVMEYIRNSGAYRPSVHTEMIDFLSLDNFDYSRTRMTDDHRHVQYDRIVNWIKPLNIFVVFDAVTFLQDDFYTTVNLWHTRKILAQGDNYFDTQYDSLRNHAFPTHKSLLIYFPEGETEGRIIGTDPEQRYYQQEHAIHQSLSRWHYAGEIASFTTILIPHQSGSDLDDKMQAISLVETDAPLGAKAVRIQDGDTTYMVASKLDRRMDLHHKDLRPQYDYEHGKVRYGDFETDAHQLFTIQQGDELLYTAVYAVKLKYKDQTLFAQPPIEFGLQFPDGIPRPGISKLRYWRDTVSIK
ncbi:hypothetical protein GF407_11620 [candidate division KSB1 bacterium]|nr:hypothetical protein [candidate division KSB1 bacterium]